MARQFHRPTAYRAVILLVAAAIGATFALAFAPSAGAQDSIPLQLTLAAPAGVEVEFDVEIDFEQDAPFALFDGDSRELLARPGKSVTIYAAPDGPDERDGNVECNGDNGALSGEFEFGLFVVFGQIPADATAVDCTITFGPVGSVPMTPLTFEHNGDGLVVFNGEVQFFALPEFSLTPGARRTFMVRSSGQVSLNADVAGGTFVCENDAGPFGSGDNNNGTRSFFEGAIPAGTTSMTCTFTGTGAPLPNPEIYPTVTCLAGNGRIDVNVVADATDKYTLLVGELSPRERTVQAGDWWRNPITGRPDGPLRVRLLAQGYSVLDITVEVACDVEPAVSTPEVQAMVACRASGGFIAWQFANPTALDRSYVITFDGVPNRSTTAAPFGASVRGVSSRPDGLYNYTVTTGGAVIDEGVVSVDC